MAADDEIKITIPQVPGNPGATKAVAAGMNAVIDALGGDPIQTASIFFTVALRMIQELGITPEEVRRRVDDELQRIGGAAPRLHRQRVAPGRPRRMRCH